MHRPKTSLKRARRLLVAKLTPLRVRKNTGPRRQHYLGVVEHQATRFLVLVRLTPVNLAWLYNRAVYFTLPDKANIVTSLKYKDKLKTVFTWRPILLGSYWP